MIPDAQPTSMQQPTFDGRMKYFELLFRMLAESKGFGLMGDMPMWYRGLELSYNMVQPYINGEKDDIRKKLDGVREKVFMLDQRGFASEQARMRYKYTIDRELLSIDCALHSAAKKLYLPMSEQVLELDVESFLKRVIVESGL